MRTKILAGVAAVTLAASMVLPMSSADARHRGYHHHGHNGGAAIAGFAAGAILGGALAAQPRYGYGPGYYQPGYDGDAVAYCLSRFRSYDPRSGTYLGYDGYRHPCP
jgi:hypothetical protein